MDNAPYHIKYRPKKFKQLLGQDATVNSLRGLLKGVTPHVFLFTGGAGCGKTTTARILASELGCLPANIIEVDAATHTGIDAMRSLTDGVRYKGFGESSKKFVIIDEIHALSRQGFSSLLKDLEDTPEHVYYAMCTTNPEKIPAAIKTRALHYILNDVKRDDLFDLLVSVCEKEELALEDKELLLIAKESNGSPRQALVNLAMCSSCESVDDIKATLRSVEGGGDFLALAKIMSSGKPQGNAGYKKCMKILRGLSDVPAETIRLSLTSYLTKCAMDENVRNEDWVLHVLSNLVGEHFNTSEKLAPMIVALADIYLAE